MPRRSKKVSATEIRRTAKSAFGWPSLRDGQLEAMTAVLSGRDTLVVMPTGAGKSACYQVPALLIDGPTVVVSPLLALQREQVLDLLSHGAFAHNSMQRDADLERAWDEVDAGEVEFIFLAPEQLAKPDIIERLRAVRPSLFVVDEAHCVAAWGHDFRPDYLRLGSVIEQLGHPVVLALTATAAPPVRADIADRLGMRDPVQLVRGFDRPNIALDVMTARSDDHKRESVVLRAAAEVKPGIVYVATRKDAERYAAELAELGLPVAPYHAGLSAAVRNKTHQAFLDDELHVVVATTAFGMGIDKPDVRFVIHADVPESLDAYYQEIGRSGRDGGDAVAVLYYRPEDLGLRKFFTSGSADPIVLQRVATLVDLHDGPINIGELRTAARLSATRLTSAINLLEDVGAIEEDSGTVLRPPEAPDPPRAAELAVERAKEREEVDRSRVEMVRAYAETPGCRRQFLLGYFGESYEPPCGRCDRCAAGLPDDAAPGAEVVWPVNTAVTHESWGHGVVMRCESDRVTVLFVSVGYKTVLLDAIQAGADA